MITLITGAPGTGKTAALVSMLRELSKDRALYVHNIPELKIPHVDLPDASKWVTDVPDGSVIVIDEVQNVWRPTGPGQRLPDHITALETHRHRGLDFYIITQGPNLLHANVRALVGRHIHLRDVGILGRYWYEWVECQDNVRSGWKSAPIKKKYKLPKAIFGDYKSSVLHVKPNRSFPMLLVVVIVAAIAFIFLAWRAYSTVSAKSSSQKPKLESPATGIKMPGELDANQLKHMVGNDAAPVNELTDFIPRISGRPWTAPAYDHLRKVVAMPIVTSAICVGQKCDCFNHESRLDMPSKDCAVWARDRPFNPYVAPAFVETASAGMQSGQSQSHQPSGGSVTETLSAKPPFAVSGL